MKYFNIPPDAKDFYNNILNDEVTVDEDCQEYEEDNFNKLLCLINSFLIYNFIILFDTQKSYCIKCIIILPIIGIFCML